MYLYYVLFEKEWIDNRSVHPPIKRTLDLMQYRHYQYQLDLSGVVLIILIFLFLPRFIDVRLSQDVSFAVCHVFVISRICLLILRDVVSISRNAIGNNMISKVTHSSEQSK